MEFDLPDSSVCDDSDLAAESKSVGERSLLRATTGSTASTSIVKRTISFGTANAKFLLTRDPSKVFGLAKLLQQLHYPDLFVVTELGRPSGTNAIDWLSMCGIDSFYQAVWTNRTLSKSGDAADASRLVGGGVMLLVHRRLQAQISVFKVQLPDDDLELIRGHLGVWRLDPASSSPSNESLACPLVVTAAYIPPRGTDWNELASDAIFSALEEYERMLLDARRSLRLDHVVIGHFNAHCSSLPCELRLSDGSARLKNNESVAKYCASANNGRSTDFSRARLSIVDGQLVIHRLKCKSASSVNDAGRRLVDVMQRFGMCPTSGVLNHCMPTTWIQCDLDCPHRAGPTAGNRCSFHSKMSNVNDLVFVDADLIVKALLSAESDSESQCMKLSTRRIQWSEKIDHAVTNGYFELSDAVLAHSAPVPDSAPSRTDQLIRKQCRRMNLPFDKRRRLQVRRLTGEMIQAGLPSFNTVDNSLSACDEAFVRCAKESLSRALRQSPLTAVEVNATESTDDVLSWRQKWRQKWREHHAMQHRVNHHLDNQSKLTALNKELRELFAQRQREHRYRRSRAISSSVAAAPKLHWKLLRHNISDPGEPAEARCKLLQRLNDNDGKLLTTDKREIRRLLLEHRKDVFSIRSDLSVDAIASIHADCQFVHLINSELCRPESIGYLPSLAKESVVARTMLAPELLWRGPQPIPQISVVSGDQINAEARSMHSSMLSRRRKFAAECAQLESAFAMPELEAVLDSLEDTGPGVDAVAVGSLTHLESGSKEWLLNFFNDIWSSGVMPDSWSEIRVVLHYKGKGSDPYCADNYRGLGIGAALEKILSLMMMKRLEAFLLSTKSLHPSQGGFLPQRGPPEQVFTLSEAIRAELKKNGAKADPVHLCFVDIERAYDSVQHVKLWASCAEMGIGGRFLSTLQTMYADKKAVLDVDGELLEPQEIQCGVLQGNPLSPLLFNIYIDKVLREFDNFAWESFGKMRGTGGVPLPIFDLDGSPMQRPPPARMGRPFPHSLLSSLFFADDGVLIARNRQTMQLMIVKLVQLLDIICLKMNARKTKVLIVPHLSASEQVYQRIKETVVSEGGYLACGRSIEIVDEFMYLGIRIWYGWDWTRAWQSARQRAHRMLYALRQAGIQNQPVPLVYQFRFAASQVLSHLDYVAAIAGVEGTGSHGIMQNEMIVNKLLRMVTGCPPSACIDALMAESGTWDFRTRLRMLQLRFFTKLTMMDTDSTHFRAMCLSKQQSDESRHRLKFYTWFDGVSNSAQHFDIPTHDPDAHDDILYLKFATSRLVPVQSLVRIERCEAGVWMSVDPDDADIINQELRVRAAHDGAVRFDYSSGQAIGTWKFSAHTSIHSAWTTWSHQMREATFAELRLRGNHVRQRLFDDILDGWTNKRSGQRDYAPLKSASYLEPYWFADDPQAARCLLRARLGYTKLEFDYRRANHHYPRASSASGLDVDDFLRDRRTIMRQLLRPPDRACYMCNESEWLPETVSHALQFCQHPVLARARALFLGALNGLVASASTVDGCPPSPDLSALGCQYYLMQLATSVGPIIHRGQPTEPPPPIALRRSLRIAHRRASHLDSAGLALQLPAEVLPVNMDLIRQQSQWLPLQLDYVKAAATWTSFFTSAWRRAIACERDGDPAAAVGSRLVNLVLQYHRSVISLRRRVLQKSASYLRRTRDPPSLQTEQSAAVI